MDRRNQLKGNKKVSRSMYDRTSATIQNETNQIKSNQIQKYYSNYDDEFSCSFLSFFLFQERLDRHLHLKETNSETDPDFFSKMRGQGAV